MKNRKLILILSLVLALTMSLGGTLAYLTDTDADVNTMVLGNVKIAQNEQMRDENGELVEYQDKPALPAVYTSEAWADEKVTISGEEFKFFAPEMKNVNDKIVTVTNMGNTKAFVRTIIAIEAPAGFNDDLVHVNVNDTKGITASGWSYATTEAGVRYVYNIFTYTDALAAKATSLPSLMQVFLDKDTTNEDVAKLGEEWEIIALSQAVQADGFADAKTALEEAFPFGESKDAAVAAWLADAENHIGTPGDKNETNTPPLFFEGDPAELAKMLAEACDAGSGDQTIELTENYDMTGFDWTPISVDGYNGAGIVTVNGNGNTIKGLNAPLFAGGFAGKSGIVINDLTIADSTIVSNSDLGAGAFIGNADSMHVITLKNCHVKNSKVSSTKECRVGGLIGWASGYAKLDDGPVKANIIVENCSVVNTKVEGFGSIGGIFGHAGASDYTWVEIKNCVVTGCELNSTDDGGWRVGVAVGTANNGHVTIENITESGNTLSQTGKTAPDGQSNLYGRFVPSGTGTLVIDGVEIK